MQNFASHPFIPISNIGQHNNIKINNICFCIITERVTCNNDYGEYQVGEMFNDDNCESRCTCATGGNIVCQPLVCPSGLIKKGKSKSQMAQWPNKYNINKIRLI